MIDGIKVLDVALSTDALLLNPRLLFPLALDEQTGAVLERPRIAFERGLSFTLTPSKVEERLRCELKGSLHRFYNQGRHNADDFPLTHVLATIDELVTSYGIDPFRSRLNNVEFGVNVSLPFPVRKVLDNLISYKYRPFVKLPGEGFAYYQATTQRYLVKLYDKGEQYRDSVSELGPHVLRVEVKVLKMEYLLRQGIGLEWLADLLNPAYHERLGKLVIQVFEEILFDEPTFKMDRLSDRQRDLYLNGRNPKVWTQKYLQLQELASQTDRASRRLYNAGRLRLYREEKQFRRLLETHRQGEDWGSQITKLISQKWAQLIQINSALTASIHEHWRAWQNLEMCNKLTGVDTEDADGECNKLTGSGKGLSPAMCNKLTGSEATEKARETGEKRNKLTGFSDSISGAEMLQINRLSIGLICNNLPSEKPLADSLRETVETGVNSGPVDEDGVSAVSRTVKIDPQSSSSSRSAQRPRPINTDDSQLTPEPSSEGSIAPGKSGQLRSVSIARVCPITGLVIAHQRADTRFVTARTVADLFITDRPAYEQLEARYLPPERAHYDLYGKSHAIARQIRQAATERGLSKKKTKGR